MLNSPQPFTFTYAVAHRTISAAVLLCLLLGAGAMSMAQVSDTGIDAFGTYQKNNIQTINLFNLDNHIEVPIFSKTARDLTFNSKYIWDLSDTFSPISGLPNKWQWNTNIFLSENEGVYNSHIVAPNQTCTPTHSGQATLIQFDSIGDQSNAAHHITIGPNQNPQLLVGPGCNSGTAAFTTGDGWILNITYTNQSCSSYGCLTLTTETDPAGNVYSSIGSSAPAETDPNGNQISINVANTVTDSTDNVVLFYNAGALAYPVQGGGTGSVQIIQTPGFTLQSNISCIAFQFDPNPISLPTAITLPDGTQYSFVYESTNGTYPSTTVTGRLHSISVPAGGTYTYAYSGGTSGVNCNDGRPAILSITGPDGSVWTYNRTVNSPNPNTTIVTDPSCNDTIYTFDPNTGLPMQVQVYQGTAGTAHCSTTSKTLLKTVVTCYNGHFTNCSTTPGSSVPPTRVDSYTYLPGLAQPSLSEQLYNSNALLTQDNEFDFGVNTGGTPTTTPLRATIIAYATVGSNILNRPSCVEVTAGSSPASCGTVISTTNSITKYLNYDSHGNVGSIQQWVSGSTYLSRSFIYTSTGLVQKVTDVNGAQTTTTYNACNGSYPDTVSEPLGLSKTLSWDCNGGVVTQIIDENSQPTTYNYNDPFWRVTKITDPSGNTTTTSYTPNTEESVLVFISPSCNTCTVDKLTTFDSMGRPHFSQTRQAPGSSNFDTVVTSYDVDSRVASIGLPCVSQQSQPCSSPVTTTTYDPLNRVLNVQDGSGGYTQYNYAPAGSFNNDVLVTIGPAPPGENTKRRQMQYDGLNRLTSVCEITGAGGSGPCMQSSTQTGYWTKYTYDALGNLKSVAQNAQGSPQQSRTFSYDGLGRLISESNPEWNSLSATYTYDTDSSGSCGGTYNGDLVKAVDPAGNVSCSQYDAFHRATLTTYPAGPNASATPARFFQYDNQYFGSTGTNIKGRLVAAGTCQSPTSCAGSSVTLDEFGYSPRGELTDIWESTANSGGMYHVRATYWSNGTVNTLSGFLASGSTFVPTITYTPDGEGRWKSVSASSGPNPISNTIYNPSGQITGLTYGSTDSDSFGYDNAGRMNSYTFQINGSSEVSAPTWNPNGTLRTLAITADPFNAGNLQTCTYGYDDIARIANANCGTPWSQTFSYDAFGNITKSGSVSWQPGYSLSNNHYTLAGTSYDADGNLTNDTFRTYAWDANGRPVLMGTKALTYDALGRMVEKKDGSSYTQFVYSPTGGLLARTAGQSATSVRVPLPGSWAVYGSSSTFNHYEHLDWLGSSRLSTTQSHGITSDVAYGPFGEPYASTATSGVSFTGMRGDVVGAQGNTTNGVYDFLAREYPYTQGRWLSPDPGGLAVADPTNPQSWNLYAYVVNNPLSAVDPDGLWCVWEDGTHDDDTGNGGFDQNTCAQQGGHWDPFDTIAGILTDGNGNITQINNVNGTICTGDCVGGMTLEGLDQTLKSYSVVPSSPSWAWTFTTSFFGHFTLNTGPGSCISAAVNSYAPVFKGFKKVQEYSKNLAPILAALPGSGASISNLIYSTVKYGADRGNALEIGGAISAGATFVGTQGQVAVTAAGNLARNPVVALGAFDLAAAWGVGHEALAAYQGTCN